MGRLIYTNKKKMKEIEERNNIPNFKDQIIL